MFTIIGGDGKEYGPATPAQIRTWIEAGRVNLDTQAKAAGSDQWRRLGEFPEFAASDAPPVMVVLPQMNLADRGVRLLAKLLDEVCAIACALPGMAILGVSAVRAIFASGSGSAASEIDFAQSLGGLVVMAVGVLALTLVQIYLISTRGQTIGKIVFGLRIVRLTDGALPGFVQGWLLRSFLPGMINLVPFGLGLVFSVVDACFIFRQDRRCIHDYIAGTCVIKA